MKTDIHPKYRPVVFQDVSCDFSFLTRSTMSSKETIKWEDGNEYPLIKVEVSSASHPFYTGKQHILQTAKQVDKFRQRYGKAFPDVRRRELGSADAAAREYIRFRYDSTTAWLKRSCAAVKKANPGVRTDTALRLSYVSPCVG